jgi:hypothetical protein
VLWQVLAIREVFDAGISDRDQKVVRVARGLRDHRKTRDEREAEVLSDRVKEEWKMNGIAGAAVMTRKEEVRARWSNESGRGARGL